MATTLVIFSGVVGAESDVNELVYLEEFLGYTDSDGVKNSEKIDADTADFTYIEGVTTSEGRVTEINFEDKGLIGELNLTKFPELTYLNINNNKISKLVLDNEKLTKIDAENGSLTGLDATKCNNLTELNVKDNYMNDLSLSDTRLTNLNIEGNLFKFSDLEMIISKADDVENSYQKPLYIILHDEINSLNIDQTIDMTVYGADRITIYNEQDEEVTPATKEGSKITLPLELVDSKIYFVMENDSYEDLTLKTDLIYLTTTDYTALIYGIATVVVIAALVFFLKFLAKYFKDQDGRLGR